MIIYPQEILANEILVSFAVLPLAMMSQQIDDNQRYVYAKPLDSAWVPLSEFFSFLSERSTMSTACCRVPPVLGKRDSSDQKPCTGL